MYVKKKIKINHYFFPSRCNNTMFGSLRTVNVRAYFFLIGYHVCFKCHLYNSYFSLNFSMIDSWKIRWKHCLKCPRKCSECPSMFQHHTYNRLSLVAISCILTLYMSTVSSHPVTESVPAADSTFMINELRSSTEGCSRHMPARRTHRISVLELLCSSPDRRSVHHHKQFFSNRKRMDVTS